MNWIETYIDNTQTEMEYLCCIHLHFRDIPLEAFYYDIYYISGTGRVRSNAGILDV
ncbi:MAG: hypothetical protein IM606_15000 [Cytophagales bacterium]|nr:hypothetical protein [Cytophagales bacterium]MCA6387861.1 hypothetical protein [Cytophagales bacterium]MCA6390941.1 hypothetical protein [Cytophagales bacterium]MCA6396489.1 hypothetical protein [Cytophagales bacterium]MCA6398384.1 hypothetical protein [Cytophagales bacterium]